MVNHLRTLLLNRPPVTRRDYPTYYLEEYEPDDFVPTVLPTSYQRARERLFGSERDRAFENYRVRQYLTLLAGGALREFVVSQDARITHDRPAVDFPLPQATWQPSASAWPVAAWHLLNDYTLADDEHLVREWDLELLTADTLQAALRPRAASTLTYAWGVGAVGGRVSVPLGLPGSTLSFSFQEGTAFPDNQGPAAVLTVVSRPRTELIGVLDQLAALSEEDLAEIFGVHQPRGVTEPLVTFRNCFYEHPNPLLRLGGFLLAYAAGIEELRRGGN